MTEQPDDFGIRLKQAVRDLPAPAPSDALLARILEDRKRGRRISLPTATRRLRRLIFIGIAAAAAAVILWIVPGARQESSEASRSSTISEVAIGMGLWPDQLYAQTAATAQFPPIPPRDGSRLHGGRWVYSVQSLDDDGRVTGEFSSTVRITEGSYLGSVAWVYMRQRQSANPGGLTDTLWLSRDSLHPLGRFSPLMYGASLATNYTGDSIVTIWRKYDGQVEHTAAALPSPRLWDTAVVMSPIELLPFFITTSLNPNWQGSTAGTAVNNAGELVTFWFDLKVAGEERIAVPGGSFDCWKVVSSWEGRSGLIYWVDKTTGWIVSESVEPNTFFRRVLVSHAAE